MNLYSGQGTVNADIGEVTGRVNTYAWEAHVAANTANLVIGDMHLPGDPSYFNAGGSVTIAGDLNFGGEDLAIVARTNILTAPGAGSINTSSGIGNGGNITMVAGANFTTNGPASGSNNTTTTLTLTGGTSAGGYIDLNGAISGSNAAITVLDSSSSSPGDNGGNITLIAFGGTGSSAGRIALPSNIAVTTGGSNNGTNGDVNIIAGARTTSGGTGVSTGDINTSGGTGGGGAINIATRTPNISGGAIKILNGSILPGSGTFAAGAAQGTSANVGNLNSGGANITVFAGTTLMAGSINADATIANVNGGQINLTAASVISPPSAPGSLKINGNVSANGNGTGSGGLVNIVYKNSLAGNPLIIGGTSIGDNYINGNVSANAGLSGATGGSVRFNSSTTSTTLKINLIGTISADGNTNDGTIIFTSAWDKV